MVIAGAVKASSTAEDMLARNSRAAEVGSASAGENHQLAAAVFD